MEELGWGRIGERIREARSAAGMSQQDLADHAALERSMITKVERGDRRVDALELSRIAQALDCPVTHFLYPSPEVVSRRAAVAESGSVGDSEAARNAYRTEVLLAEWLRDVRWLMEAETLEQLPLLKYPHSAGDTEQARLAARWLRSQLALAKEPVGSLAETCERAGQFVAALPLPGDGASLVDGGIAVAVVSRELLPGRRRSTAAHELGHMVLGDEYSSDLGVHASREERERLVEVFAAEFLLPREVLREVTEQAIPEDRRAALIKISAEYRVSWSLAIAQLRHTGAAAPDELNALRARTPTDVDFRDAVGWRPQPDLTSVRVPPRYASAVYSALRSGLITSTRAVEMTRGQVSLSELTEEADD